MLPKSTQNLLSNGQISNWEVSMVIQTNATKNINLLCQGDNKFRSILQNTQLIPIFGLNLRFFCVRYDQALKMKKTTKHSLKQVPTQW